MSELKKIHITSDVTVEITLTADDHPLDLLAAEKISVLALNRRSGACVPMEYSIRPTDTTRLVAIFPASRQLSLGDYEVVVRMTVGGTTVTYDDVAFTLVPTTEASDTMTSIVGVTIDTKVSVISLEDVRSLEELFSKGLAAEGFAKEAGEFATAAAGSASASQKSAEEAKASKDYFDSDAFKESVKGDKGDKGDDGKDGKDGGLLFPSFSYDAATGVFTIEGKESEVSRFEYNIDEGILTIKL